SPHLPDFPPRRSSDLCESGATCTGNRDLYDDFGVAASPTTGLASIVYSDDQYSNTPTHPAGPYCTPSRTNTGSCDSTNIATQTRSEEHTSELQSRGHL